MLTNCEIKTWPGLVARILDRQFLVFVIIGCSNFLIGFVTFHSLRLALSGWSWRSFWAQMVAYGIGTVWSFFWNRRLTFRSHRPITLQATKFVSLQGTLAFGSAISIGYGVDRVGFPGLLYLACYHGFYNDD